MLNINLFLMNYILPTEKVVLACSGGPDSICLLEIISNSRFNKNLVVASFDHNLRKDSKDEIDFVENIAREKGLIFEKGSMDIKELKNSEKSISTEEIARRERYNFLRNVKDKYNVRFILTAHHLDDKIETFFLNMLRGTKLSGLINMTDVSGDILRPLLGTHKQDIVNYLDENKIEYKIDSSNLENDYTRNFLRNKIIPNFNEINSNYKNNLKNLFRYFEDLKGYLNREVDEFIGTSDYFYIKDFLELDYFMQKEVISRLFYLANNNSTIGLSEANIGEFIKFINGKNNKTFKEIKGLRLEKDNMIIKIIDK